MAMKKFVQKRWWLCWYGKCIVATAISTIQENYICKHCILKAQTDHKSVNEAIIKQASLKVTVKTTGFASRLYVECKCGKHPFIVGLPRVSSININDQGNQMQNSISQEKTYHVSDFAINMKAFLMTQMLGIGFSGLNTIIALLGI